MTNIYNSQIEKILDESRVQLSDMLPSVWAENNIQMTGPFPGPLRYDKTPYTRKIIDCFARTNPAREIAIMGAAQWGKTMSIIIPVIGYIIENDPGPIILTVGHADLLDDAMNKVDFMLDTTGLRKLIKSSAQRAKSQKTGDTNTMKEFPMGFLKLSEASNPKIWRQSSYKFGLIDDYDAIKGKTKVAGSNRALIGKRFTAYAETKKILYASSPELEQNSNILEIYLMGTQEKFLVPCPCCGTFIELVWTTPKVGDEKEMCGILWETDSNGRLIEDSVCYKCQECGDTFTDQNKSEYIEKGYWKETAKPFRPDIVSFYMNSLYSPHGMSDWKHYVYQYLDAHPNGVKDESKYQTFLNLDLGLPYKAETENLKASDLQKNVRNYDIGIVPEKMSIADGNGKIVLLTFACDLNGKVEDARLDWEIVGWSENGTSYSISHGSIGTFIPNESGKKNKVVRETWTYEHNKQNSVWPELNTILNSDYLTDTGRKMKILISGIDTGYCELQAFTYIDNSNLWVVGLKGDKEDKYVNRHIEQSNFKVGQSRSKLFMVRVGRIKDNLAALMKLKWDSGNDEVQPSGFMNFPTPAGGKYLFQNYFSHFEAEVRKVDNEGNYIWEKKTATAQNHLFDCRIYNMVLKEIITHEICKQFKIPSYTWNDFVGIILGKIK